MNLTTLAKVKALMPQSGAVDTDVDDTLNRLIALVSLKAETIMQRKVLTGVYVETFDVDAEDELLYIVKAPPIAASPTISVVNDSTRAFTNSALDDDFVIPYTDETGRVKITVGLVRGPQALQITYTGGMGEDTAGFVAAYPELAEVLTVEVLNLWQRLPNMGVEQTSTGVDTLKNRPFGFLKGTRDTLARYTRHAGF